MLPERVWIQEVGPREGFQFEKTIFPAEVKAGFVDALADCGFPVIEVGSFVRPDRVPQMADTEDVFRSIRRRPNVKYTGVYLNLKGLERGLAVGADFHHSLSLTSSATFSRMNLNRDEEGSLRDLARRAELLRQMGVDELDLNVGCAFGCNYEGPIAPATVLEKLRLLKDMADRFQFRVARIGLHDTMGWSSPRRMDALVQAVRRDWDPLPIRLHIHDTRGLGIASAFEALQLGVADFDAAVGGLGGCPFAGHKGAAGNIATEDFVLLCEELGIETGVDLDGVIRCAVQGEQIVGHPLPGKVKIGGRLLGRSA